MPGLRILLSLAIGLATLPVAADEIRIAVAANFTATLQRIAGDFTRASGHRVLISSSSTGKHYAQIRNGAGFDIFFAADAERPALLEQQGIGVPGSRFVYATGRLALWTRGEAVVGDPADVLRGGRFARLAIANPRLAPYGLAAEQALRAWQLWDKLQPKLVRGENVGQAYQYAATGNAEWGLVALSQVLAREPRVRGSYAIVPATLHTPISQEALLLRPSRAGEAFLAFLRGDAAAQVLREAGYAAPGRS
ncbi:MAG: molybdate ABC transporter substrate-binding protein [Chromatiaceae bacterium]|nr:molybdate ABC transporter substrate-binding protein [Chromatiaceae bacterium]